MVFPDKIKTAFRQFLFLARVAGFEPAHDGIRIHCLTTWRYPIVSFIKVGWIVGFEPTHNGATIHCLNHLTIPTIYRISIIYAPCSLRNRFFEKLAIRNGLEPSTSSVTGWHSNQLNYQAASMLVNLLNCRVTARNSNKFPAHFVCFDLKQWWAL